MPQSTFPSAGKSYKITMYPEPHRPKKHPMLLLLHGNFGLGPPYGDQIRGFAKDLAALGYLTAVPQYFEDDLPHLTDTVPHHQTLADAIAAVALRPDADPTRLGLIGFSLGAATSMTYIATNPPGSAKVLADFFGFLTPAIRAGISKFPPTIIHHNKNDGIVYFSNSQELDRLLPTTTDHRLYPYDEVWPIGNHAFKPGGAADVDSRAKTAEWFTSHMPPTGA